MNFFQKIFLFFSFIATFFLVAPTSALASLPTEKQFTGHVFDQASDLYYMRARYYDPVIGRFLSPDQGGGSLNRYFYVYNNPLAFIDPMGEQGRWAHEGTKNETPLMPHAYEQWVKLNFPSALEQFWPVEWQAVKQSVRVSASNAFQLTSLGNQQDLDRLALRLIERNPYDPATQTYEFVDYLQADIHSSFPYNPGLSKVMDELEEPLEALSAPVFDFEDFSKSTYGPERLQYGGQLYLSFMKGGLLAWPYLLTPLASRVETNSMVCLDFAWLNSYVLSRAGVKSAMLTTASLTAGGEPLSPELIPVGHVFNVVKIGDTYYKVDPTWGYMVPVDEDWVEYTVYSLSSPWLEEFQSLNK